MWLSAFIITVYVLNKILKQYLFRGHPVAPDPTAIKSILVLGFPVGATMFLETAVFTGIAFWFRHW